MKMKLLVCITILLLAELKWFPAAALPQLVNEDSKVYTGSEENVRGKRINIGSISIVNRGVLLDPCTRHSDCTVDNSRCRSNVCQCKSGYVSIRQDKENCYEEVKVDEECSIDEQCGFRQECATVCSCQTPYVKLVDVRGDKGCYEIHDSLGETCTHSGQCNVENSKCISGECGCDNGYREDGDGGCEGDRPLGGPCSTTSQCAVDNAECIDGSCKCSTGYERLGAVCFEVDLPLGSTCNYDTQCAAEFSACEDGSCQCEANYLRSGSSCYLSDRPLGSTCSVNAQCTADNSECKDGSCQCTSGFEKSGSTCQAVVSEITRCEEQGGSCVPKNSRCCPKKMSLDTSLCQGSNTHICCLPASQAAGAGGGVGAGNGTSGGSDVSVDCKCSAKHEQTLADAESNFMLGGSLSYDPVSQVPLGAVDRTCLPREPACGDPEDVCLKNRVLNLLQCAPEACNGPSGVWKLHSLLNSNTCVGSNCQDFCDGNGVLFERLSQQCGFGQLKNMCEDTGGAYTKDGEYVWCLY